MLKSIKSFMVITMLIGFLHLAQFGCKNGSASTVQAQFDLSLVEYSYFGTFYSIVNVFTVIPFNFYVSKSDIPFHLSWQCLLMSAGCFFYALPGFLKAEATEKGEEYEICLNGAENLLENPFNNNTADCSLGSVEDEEAAANTGFGSWYYWMFMFSYFCTAIGSSCWGQSGIAMINANASPNIGSLYISLVFTGATVGLTVGFISVGIFINRGAWYVPHFCWSFGYLILAALMHSIPAVPKPRGIVQRRASTKGGGLAQLPKASVAPISKDKSVHVKSEHSGNLEDSSNLKRSKQKRESSLISVAALEAVRKGRETQNLWTIVKEILTDDIWIMCACGSACENFMLSAVSTHGAQQLSSYFSVQKGMASFLLGITLVPAMGIGNITGGGWDSKRNKSLTQTSLFNFKCALMSALIFLPMFFLRCPQVEVQGLNEATFEMVDVGCSLSTGCQCERRYAPVCLGNVSYFNPCYAGCTNWDSTANIDSYTNDELFSLRESCSCYPVEDFNNNNNNITKLSDGICEIAQCPQLSSFLLIFFFGLLFTSMNGTPTTIILLRCIPTELGAMSLAVNGLFYQFLGSIPGPLVMGAVMDAGCKLKNMVTGCVEGNSCGVFAMHQMWQGSASVVVVTKLFSAFFCFVTFYKLKQTIEGNKLYIADVDSESNHSEGFRKHNLASEDTPKGRKRSVMKETLIPGRKRSFLAVPKAINEEEASMLSSSSIAMGQRGFKRVEVEVEGGGGN